jgi:NADH-quinone oxidoreductase subunit H
MVGTDLNVGILFMVAISSVTTIAILTAGWASNNKYALLSALRVAAQMVSYEVPMVLSILGVVLLTSSLSMVSIVGAQEQVWFVIAQPIAFLIFFICALAEVNRSPFDIPEAESEIVAGFHIEYSGIKFAMFFLAEYINTFVVSAIAVSLFLGGWQGPILPPYVWFFLKVFSVVFVIMWIRGTLPRLRVDQFMSFAWKFLVPLALANVLATGFVLGIVGPYLNDPYLSALALLVANGVMAAVVLAILFVSNRKAKERRLRERVA